MTKTITMILLLILVHAPGVWAQGANRSAPGPVAMQNFGGTCRVGPRWCLGAVSVVRQQTGSEGGPQALEGYTIVDTRSKVRLAMGVIGNVEQAGSGEVVEVRPLQSGGVITGTGPVERWTGLWIDKPKEQAPGQLLDYRAIQFSNGFYITTAKDQQGQDTLVVCAPDRRCTVFR
jgi:hypothetical protein